MDIDRLSDVACNRMPITQHAADSENGNLNRVYFSAGYSRVLNILITLGIAPLGETLVIDEYAYCTTRAASAKFYPQHLGKASVNLL
ncbi:hypothetical protein [Paraburkholderia fungorum]|nr:hypothetical protein [Paraburkholderia fungorum]